MRFLKSLTLFLAVTCALLLSALPPVHAQAAPALEGMVNINAAGAEELRLLPGVDKKTAEAIVSFRAKNGNFKTADDLGKVNGIGPKRLGKIKQYLALEGETTLKKR